MAEQETTLIEPLKVLYDGGLVTLRFLSERSFTATLQALTLNIAVVAGLIGGKVELSSFGQTVGSALLISFNGFVIGYLAAKARAHYREKEKFVVVQTKLQKLVDVNFGRDDAKNTPSFWRSFFGGSGLFIASLMLAGTISVAAMWVPLLASHSAQQVNPAVHTDAAR